MHAKTFARDWRAQPPVYDNSAKVWPGRAVGTGHTENRGMEQTIFIISMFFGVAAVALIAFTLLWIALGKLSV